MLDLDPKSSALVLIDLQEGVVPMSKAPRSGAEVVATAKRIAARFREAGAPVFLVHVSLEPGNMPSQQVDQPGVPPDGTPDDFSRFVKGLVEDGDIAVLKHHWGAFTGTDLDLQLRRRNCQTLVVGGIATNMGVESTVRSAWELSYDVVVIEDAIGASSQAMHAFALDHIFPQIARVRASSAIRFSDDQSSRKDGTR